MKKLLLGTAIAAVLGASASAQDLFRTEMDPVAITASDFIGKRVYAAEAAIDADEYAGVQDGWNDIGEINDVILTRDGKVDAVLVDIGGFLGMGERQVALGMESIRFVSDGGTADDLNDYFLVVNADRATLEGAPDFVRTGAMPADATNDETAKADEPVVDDATNDETAKADEPVADDATVAADTEVATTEPAQEGDNTMTGRVVEGYATVDAKAMTTDELIGARVYGPNDEDVGEIGEVVLDDSGMATQIIVDVGGFLGIGEKPVALDFGKLEILKANEGGALRVYVPMSQDELEELPAVSM